MNKEHPIVRPASTDDIPAIAELLRCMHAEGIYKGITINNKKATEFISNCLLSARHFCCLSETIDREMSGIIIGYVTEYFFSDEIGAWDVVVYVRPQDRKTGVALALCSAFRQWSIQKGARFLWLGNSVNINPERSHEFYINFGMNQVGSLYRSIL